MSSTVMSVVFSEVSIVLIDFLFIIMEIRVGAEFWLFLLPVGIVCSLIRTESEKVKNFQLKVILLSSVETNATYV